MARVGSSPSVLDLPTEMLQRIFQLLPLTDMHSVVQVRREMIYRVLLIKKEPFLQ